MPSSQTTVTTASGKRYLQQLCKHWSHKFPVEFTSETGRVRFAADRSCSFEADLDGLTMRIEAADTEALGRMEEVVVEHLKRFSFREDLGEIAWTRA